MGNKSDLYRGVVAGGTILVELTLDEMYLRVYYFNAQGVFRENLDVFSKGATIEYCPGDNSLLMSRENAYYKYATLDSESFKGFISELKEVSTELPKSESIKG